MQTKQIVRIGVMVMLALAAICWISILATEDDQGGLISPFIYLAYLTVFIATSLSLFYSITALLKSPNAKKVFINVAIFIGIFLIGLATGNSTEAFDKDGVLVASSFTSRMVSAGLFMFYVLALGAIGLMIYTSFARLKK